MIALSQHAVDRYHERICPDLSRDEAVARLRDVTARARKMRDRTRYGQLRYQGPDCVLIVKATEDRGLMVVTVYPDAVYQGEEVSAEWVQVLERIQVSAERELQPVSIPPPAPPPPTKPSRPAAVVARVEDPRVEHALAALERLVERYGPVRDHYEAALAGARRETERHRAHGQKMQRDLDTAKRTLRRVAALLSDTPEAREALGEFGFLLEVDRA